MSNESSNILPEEEQTILSQYLEQGGQLLLSSQNASDICGNTTLFTDYLKVNHLQNTWSGALSVKGIDNDTIGDGLEFLIYSGDGNNSSLSPSVIEAIDEAVPFFHYANTSNCCGVRNEDDFKSIYLSFGIEAVNNPDDRIEILNRTLNWFDNMIVTLPELDPHTELQKSIRIFPNPSNGELNIQLRETTEDIVEINISDLSGKQYFSHKKNNSGQSFILIEDMDIPSGIYLINIKTNQNCYSQKLVFGF